MKSLWIIIISIGLPVLSCAQKDWYANFSPGLSYAPPIPLIVNQSGFPQLSFWANYKTEPLILPIYYSYRIGFTNQKKGWELEMNHLKISLKNKPEEIQQFSISHGYNQLFVNKIYKHDKYGIKIGAGVVLAHPENIVRNYQLNGEDGILNRGYYLAGPVIQLGIYKELCVTKRFYFLVESKISLAYSNVPVSSGRAHVPLLGMHLQIGPEFFFIKKERQN